MKKRSITVFSFFAFIILGVSFFHQTAHAVDLYSEIDEQIAAPQPRITIPGLKFTNAEDVKRMTHTGIDGNTYLTIPYLGEYLAAVYRYAIVVIGVLAVIMIIVAGFQISTSGGDSSSIEAGKTRIAQAIIGLMLAVGSYTILYVVNPNLVSFRNLAVLYVHREAELLPEEAIAEYGSFTPQGVTPPPWNHETFDCTNKESYLPRGVVAETSLETYTCDTGMIGEVTTIKDMQEPLCKVAEKIEEAGYTLVFKDSYRPFKDQVEFWCGQGAEEYKNTAERKKYYAVPGYSNHGHGNAIDVHLGNKDGKRLYENINSKTQCAEDPALVALIANAFLDSDPNFHRLETEVWHFEYGISSNPKVGNYRGLPASCTNRS